MLAWLRKRLGRSLEGAPAVPRTKSYTAESGYVYAYLFQGRRDLRIAGEPATEYVFRVSADRREYLPVSVFLAAAAVKSWEEARGRELSSTERYALVKLALFHALDERPGPDALREPVHIRLADIDRFAETLGFI